METYTIEQEETVYLYTDKNNLIVYCYPEDDVINEHIALCEPNRFKRFVLKGHKTLGIFFHYYELQFHPLTLKNVVK